VSASDADIVLGRSPYKTRYRLFAEKKGLILPENLENNPHVRRGIRLEPLARKAFEQRHDTLLLPLCAESDDYPFLRASFDGIDDNGIPVEIKAPSEKNFRDTQNEFEAFTMDEFNDALTQGASSKLYNRYYSQVQQQICVAGTDRAWLSFYLNDHEYVDFSVPRDDVFIGELIFEATKFVKCLENNIPPERIQERDIYIPSGQDLDQWNALAANYHRIEEMIEACKSKINPLDKELTRIKTELLKLMGEFTQAESAGIKISRYLQQGHIDYKAALLAIKPDIDSSFLDSFRNNSSERTRFTSKDEQHASVPFSMDTLIRSAESDYWF
ncbi:MAG: YqaJ viral recombinase family protein, partial [Methylovulum sp.]|nr:YqaJ viral recombinase family protein [Methylovulum sp.]